MEIAIEQILAQNNGAPAKGFRINLRHTSAQANAESHQGTEIKMAQSTQRVMCRETNSTNRATQQTQDGIIRATCQALAALATGLAEIVEQPLDKGL